MTCSTCQGEPKGAGPSILVLVTPINEQGLFYGLLHS